MTVKVTRFVFLTVLLVVAMTSAQAAIIFQDGFNGVGSGGGFETVGAGGNINGVWTVGGAGVDWIHSYWTPAEGDGSVDLSSTGAGSVSATFATVIGNAYLVTFDMAGNPDGGFAVKYLYVDVGGGADGYGFDTTGRSSANMGWVSQSYNFVATSTSTTLKFTSFENNSYGPALDNVIVADARQGEVPEPGTYALMAGGLAALAFLRRKR